MGGVGTNNTLREKPAPSTILESRPVARWGHSHEAEVTLPQRYLGTSCCNRKHRPGLDVPVLCTVHKHDFRDLAKSVLSRINMDECLSQFLYLTVE